MVVLHLDDATDAKSLIGAYVCGDAPGEFRWQPGVLARALSEGCWLLLESVDAAPPEVLAALLPLLEGKPLLTGRGEALVPASGFRLFATAAGISAGRRELASAGLWARVHCTPPEPAELAEILTGCFPAVAPCMPPLLDALFAAQTLCGQVSSEVPLACRAITLGRPLCLRDAVRWARRLAQKHAGELNADPASQLSQRLRELAYCEGADIVAGALCTGAPRDTLLAALATAWGVTTERAEHLERRAVPELALLGGVLQCGRARIGLHAGGTARISAGFALTGHATRVLERLAAAVASNEPALLVGETGTGKTAAVQALAHAVGARLVVVNMSTQSDSADLLGGFKPQDPAALCLPLLASFVQLFAETFPRDPNSEFAARVVRLPCCCWVRRMRPSLLFRWWQPAPAAGSLAGRTRDLRHN